MTIFNITLSVLVVTCYLYNLYLYKKISTLTTFTGSGFAIIKEALTRLSFSFVNQELEIIPSDNNYKISLIKYHNKNHWGIKLIIEDLDKIKSSQLVTLLNKDFDSYEFNLDSTRIIIDCKNNIESTVRLIEQLFIKFLGTSQNKVFLFTKKSVLNS